MVVCDRRFQWFSGHQLSMQSVDQQQQPILLGDTQVVQGTADRVTALMAAALAAVLAAVLQRKDSNFALILGAAFLLPALLILGIAYGTGYLDSLYSNTMTNMR
jgi:hypothetical protein